MFRATVLTSAVGGLAFGLVVAVCEPVAQSAWVAVFEIVVFIGTSILLVGGVPQIKQKQRRDSDRAALDPRRRPPYLEKLSEDVDEFYLPGLARIFVYFVCLAAVYALVRTP